MIDLRPASDRFATRLDWLESRHSFAFGAHYDPERLSFGPLRVINEDRIAPRSGFPTHGHREMEILSYVIEGALSHRDSEGHATTVEPGRVQLMHAGTGIAHSELNLDAERPVHLLQIWIEPEDRGTQPGYEELDFTLEPGRATVLASAGGAAGGLALRQDAAVSALRLAPGQEFAWQLGPGRRGWVQVASGDGHVQGVDFAAGDGLAIEDRSLLPIEATEHAELLLFDLPGEAGARR